MVFFVPPVSLSAPSILPPHSGTILARRLVRAESAFPDVRHHHYPQRSRSQVHCLSVLPSALLRLLFLRNRFPFTHLLCHTLTSLLARSDIPFLASLPTIPIPSLFVSVLSSATLCAILPAP